MDRKGRRALIKRSGQMAGRGAAKSMSPMPNVEELHQAALMHRRKGELLAAQTLCRAILARDPKHLGALIIMGGTSQEQGRNNAALKFLREALAVDDRNPRLHDNLGLTYQALGRHDESVLHFSRAIALGLRNIEPMVKEPPAVSIPMNRLAANWPRQSSLAELFGPDGLRAIAGEGLLLALLRCRVVCDLDLERFLTGVRSGLLQALAAGRMEGLDEGLRFFCAVAMQCFINEYIYPLSDTERDQSARWCDRLAEALQTGSAIAPLDVVVAAMYRPLHALPIALALRASSWPAAMDALLTQQIREPMEEASYRDVIPALTDVEGPGSIENERQFDENPYPRWVTQPPAPPMTVDDYLHSKLGYRPFRGSLSQ